MATSVKSGEYLTLVEACKLIPGRPHKNTVRRYMHKGHEGRYLKFWRVGGKIFTTEDAIAEFIGSSQPTDSPATSSSQQAVEQLDAMGVKQNHLEQP
jgi:hypothetical protein